jgi:phage protein D
VAEVANQIRIRQLETLHDQASLQSEAEAQQAADAKMAALNRGLRQGTVTLAKGDPSIRAAQPLVIMGMRPGIDGSYIVQTATHTFTRDEGISTTLEIYDPGTGEDFTSELMPDAGNFNT